METKSMKDWGKSKRLYLISNESINKLTELVGEKQLEQLLCDKQEMEDFMEWLVSFIRSQLVQEWDNIDKYQGYLLQRFNEYEVPLKMTAEEVRDLIIKFYKEYGK